MGNGDLPVGNVRKLKFGAATGILAPIVGFTCILVAIASYPAFSWTSNALSDLGVIKGITGLLFNFGLCATGLLALSFALLGLFVYIGKTWVGEFGATVFAAASLALVAIGVFNENYAGIHYAVSVAFFVLMPISMFITACAFSLAHRGQIAIFTVLTGVVAALPWILLFAFHYVPNVAIPEFVSGLIVSAWTIILGYKML